MRKLSAFFENHAHYKHLYTTHAISTLNVATICQNRKYMDQHQVLQTTIKQQEDNNKDVPHQTTSPLPYQAQREQPSTHTTRTAYIKRVKWSKQTREGQKIYTPSGTEQPN